jgi:hypothetical protein
VTFLARILMVVAIFAASCADAPSQHDPARHGRVLVFYGADDWTSQQRDAFAAELLAMEALGPDFTLATELAADVVVRHWDSGDGCTHGAADYTAATHTIRIDPVCTHGDLELRTALGHELGHFLGMTHVCRSSGELPVCSPVGTGAALMNPRLSYGDPEITTDRVYDGEVAPVWPHALDLAEFNRVHP